MLGSLVGRQLCHLGRLLGYLLSRLLRCLVGHLLGY
jgi:hypothetical protein